MPYCCSEREGRKKIGKEIRPPEIEPAIKRKLNGANRWECRMEVERIETVNGKGNLCTYTFFAVGRKIEWSCLKATRDFIAAA